MTNAFVDVFLKFRHIIFGENVIGNIFLMKYSSLIWGHFEENAKTSLTFKAKVFAKGIFVIFIKKNKSLSF